jgi:hypothetical protein
MSARRPGFALVAVLAALAIVEIAVLAVLLICREADASARDAAALARARAASEAAVRSALARWDESTMRAIPSLTRVPLSFATGSLPGSVQYTATAERLARGIWYVSGEGTLIGGGQIVARARSAALATAIPLTDFNADFQAALVSGGPTHVLAAATIDATRTGALPPAWSPADCAPYATQNASVVRPAVALGALASLSGAGTILGLPPVLYRAPRTDSSDFARLGPLRWSELANIADRVESGALSLAPARSGSVCDVTATGNWGAPADPAHPCFDYFPLVYSPGPLTITGLGQGILAVEGPLTLAPGTQFSGVILARSLDATQSEITGSVRVESSTRVSAVIRYNECAVQRALHRSPALRRVYRYAKRWWLPGFG